MDRAISINVKPRTRGTAKITRFTGNHNTAQEGVSAPSIKQGTPSESIYSMTGRIAVHCSERDRLDPSGIGLSNFDINASRSPRPLNDDREHILASLHHLKLLWYRRQVIAITAAIGR